MTAAELSRRMEAARAAFNEPADPKPLDMVLHCPACGRQHIDAPEPGTDWDNPPHRSHQCHGCGTVWRPADVPTNGVARTQTRGKADSWPGGGTPGKGDQ